MGSAKKLRKKFENPKKLWDETRLKEEKQLVEEYGLKNMRELWKAQTILRKLRRDARRLLSGKGAKLEERAERLITRCKKYFINKDDLKIEDILGLKVTDLLERRLQTIIWRKHLGVTPKMSRQIIIHGHIAIDESKVSIPSYIVSFSEESKLNWFGKPVSIQMLEKKVSTETPKKEEVVASEVKSE
ncbi:30S ribosomal protein S4 [uncultured archaeon]|nr:30S ribosomal protein S4 [uncultured archaeon]